MSRRFELTDDEWDLLRPLLPPTTPQRGGRWREHRQVLNGIIYRTGIPWRDLPERYGPWSTAHQRLLRWEADSTWARIEEHLLLNQERDLDSPAPPPTRPTRRCWRSGAPSAPAS